MMDHPEGLTLSEVLVQRKNEKISCRRKVFIFDVPFSEVQYNLEPLCAR